MLLFTYKPSMMFDINGNIKNFDYESNDSSGSLLSIMIVLPIIAIMCYFMVIIMELMIY